LLVYIYDHLFEAPGQGLPTPSVDSLRDELLQYRRRRYPRYPGSYAQAGRTWVFGTPSGELFETRRDGENWRILKALIFDYTNTYRKMHPIQSHCDHTIALMNGIQSFKRKVEADMNALRVSRNMEAINEWMDVSKDRSTSLAYCADC
jgi:hypothetical protein